MNRTARIILLAMALVAAVDPARAHCVGDCGGDRVVTVDELVRAVNLALRPDSAEECAAVDANHDRHVTIDELVLAVQNSLAGCGGGSLADLHIPDNFDYATSREVSIDLAVCTPNGNPFPGVALVILAPPTAADAPTDIIWRGATDARGRYRGHVQAPARFPELRVVISAPGIVNDVVVPVIDGRIMHHFQCALTNTDTVGGGRR